MAAARRARSASSASRLPACGWTHDGVSCRKRGDHFCKQRADHAQAFFEEVLVHTKGRYARKAFMLAAWQRDDIVRPIFGTVRWSVELGEYVRRYSIVWIELARKNGKSEILAGIMLYLLVADGEESAELYGCARDREQASLVFDVAARMVQLSPALSKRLTIKQHVKRIIDPKTNSFYQVIAADAAGALGSNPSGIAADEILAWRDRSMWDAQRTGMGSRRQPLLAAATTAGNDSESFAGGMHAEMQRVEEEPERAPHVLVIMRNTPTDADPFDEANWDFANPALDDFLSRETLRQEALEARNDPSQENAFRQFRLNQWVAQSSRWMPMHLYAACTGEPWATPDWRVDALEGRLCYAGLDLAARYDLTSWCLLFPGEPVQLLWRFWLPEAIIGDLDKATGGQVSVWIREGWLTVTEGEVTDFDRVYDDIAADCGRFTVRDCSFDPWSGDPAVQAIQKRTGLEMEPVPQNYAGLSAGMHELMSLTKSEAWEHHGNPVARWCFDSVEVKHPSDNPDLIKPVKPQRSRGAARIDGVVTACLATAGYLRHLAVPDYDVLESIW